MDKKLYEMPFLKVNRFEIINPLMVVDDSNAFVDDEEVEDPDDA